MECPPGQHWAIKYNWCDFPERANCEAGSTDKPTSKPSSKEQTDKPSSKEKGSKEKSAQFEWGMEEDF